MRTLWERLGFPLHQRHHQALLYLLKLRPSQKDALHHVDVTTPLRQDPRSRPFVRKKNILISLDRATNYHDLSSDAEHLL